MFARRLVSRLNGILDATEFGLNYQGEHSTKSNNATLFAQLNKRFRDFADRGVR
jgi:hypothetical protein